MRDCKCCSCSMRGHWQQLPHHDQVITPLTMMGGGIWGGGVQLTREEVRDEQNKASLFPIIWFQLYAVKSFIWKTFYIYSINDQRVIISQSRITPCEESPLLMLLSRLTLDWRPCMSHQQPNMTIMYHESISRSHNSLFVIRIAHCTSLPLTVLIWSTREHCGLIRSWTRKWLHLWEENIEKFLVGLDTKLFVVEMYVNERSECLHVWNAVFSHNNQTKKVVIDSCRWVATVQLLDLDPGCAQHSMTEMRK